MFLSKPTTLKKELRPLLAPGDKEKLTRNITPRLSLVQVKPGPSQPQIGRVLPSAVAVRDGALRTQALLRCCDTSSPVVFSVTMLRAMYSLHLLTLAIY